MLRIRNMDIHKRARENDSVDATQNASAHYTNEKKVQSSTTHNDQDSDVSFENDTDEEIDTTEIEEENWIEYIKRSTGEAMEKIKNAKIRCWNKTQKKNDMETGAENNYITERKMVEESCRMEP